MELHHVHHVIGHAVVKYFFRSLIAFSKPSISVFGVIGLGKYDSMNYTFSAFHNFQSVFGRWNEILRLLSLMFKC